MVDRETRAEDRAATVPAEPAQLPTAYRLLPTTTTWTRFLRNRRAVVGAAVIALLCAVALAAPLVAPYPPEAQTLAQRYRPPSGEHVMGTDGFGRDIFSRAVWASRISLSIGVV